LRIEGKRTGLAQRVAAVGDLYVQLARIGNVLTIWRNASINILGYDR
jgi:hypothetical protein